ncbi:hypothetical protein [Novilysobacter erysipheiresistens]|uniref:Ig-like domain-containing protein n=1 Tax=Novilysobacter erysipheiresistens TaxID=1749332 RepID=A0ABU7YUD7_9GAMM
MPAPIWKPGTLYLPGDLVQPASVQPATSSNVANGDFSGGATGWDFTGGVAYTTTNGYDGPGHYCYVPGSAASGEALNQTQIPTAAGESITATCRIQQGASDVDHTRGLVILRWYDAGGVQIGSDDLGNVVNDGKDGAWHESTITAVAPIGASYARAGIGLYQDSNDGVYGDDLVVTGTYRIPADALFYRAVQPAAGVSAASEPAWPQSLGVQVIDNEVIWEAVLASRVTWIASPIAESGGTEPNWPTQPGAVVSDGTVQWECITRAVEDENCPNTKVVAIMAGKVFAADGDITRFSATANPLDWTSENDAGYLPTGMNQANANDMAVLAPYRGNLACFNANGFQLYQVDPDPAAMAQLDQMEGVGSTWTLAAQAVANDLLYLSQQGVRSVGIANAAENLAAGDVGSPIDVLVRDAVRVAVANDNKIHSAYYPGAGQYWLAFTDYPPPALTISGDLPGGFVGDSGTYQYTASGGVLPHTFAISSGSLPPGATMDATGLVTYDYTAEGDYTWTVSVTDSDGAVATLVDSATITPVILLLIGTPGSGSTTPAAQTSEDGATFTDIPRASLSARSACGYGGGQWVAISSTECSRSADLLAWSPSTYAGTAAAIAAVAYGDGAWVAAGSSGSRFRSSDDAASFVSVYDADATYTCAAYGNGVWIFGVAGTVQGPYRYSVDGGLTTAKGSAVFGYQMDCANYANGLWVAGGRQDSSGTIGQIRTSVDPLVGWTSRVDDAPSAVVGVAYGNSLWVAVCEGGQVLTSADAWATYATQTFTATSPVAGGVVFSGGKFYIFSGTQVSGSADGVTWDSAATGLAEARDIATNYEAAA